MSIKIVVFGESEQAAKFLEKSKGVPNQPSDEAIIVENIAAAQSNFLLFSVKDKSLVSAQATGSNGLIFFLGGDTPLFEEKQFLIDLLSSRVEFDGVPIAVLFEKGQQLNLKDVVNYMELYRLKDRASMIKEITWDQKEWIGDIYSWVKGQSQQSRGGRGFQAAPKVVKMKAKYRQNVEDESEKKYQGLLDQKDIQGLGVKQQEDVYIEREKDKIKKQNMEKQLSMFSRNKKKMSPYDIKPTPNPKIDPNLHFFLKDPHSQPPPEVSIKIQTDEFKDRPAPPPYKPKKTGINIATQIEENQLYNFDKEVKPILAILTTKALESAALELEEQEELDKMVRYRKAYDERVRKQKDHEQKNIDEELRIIKQKEKLLKEHRQKIEAKKNIQRRTQGYQLANNFLSGIYIQTANRLVTSNTYPDSLSNFLKTEYLDLIFSKAAVNYNELCQSQLLLSGVFENDVVGPFKKQTVSAKEAHENIKKKRVGRSINQSTTARKVHILYKHDFVQFSNFSKYLNKHFDNSIEQYVKTREEQINQVSDRVQTGEATQQQLFKAKNKDSQQFAAAGHQNFLINDQELCFTWTSNKYEGVKHNSISSGFLLLDKQGQIVEDPTFGSAKPQLNYVRLEQNLRQQRESINMDQGIAIDLSKVPEKVKCIVVLARVPDVQKYKIETELKKIKHAAYGVQFWQHKIPIHSKSIGETVKWEEVAKVSQGDEAPPTQHALVVSYVLRRRIIPEFWTLEDVAYVPQPYKTPQELNSFIEELSKFYFRSHDYIKEEEDEEKYETAPPSREKKSSSRQGRSKKLIEEPKKKLVMRVSTKILNQVTVGLDEPLEDNLRKLYGSVEEWKQFLESCENGWQILLKGKKIESTSQLSAFRKVGDLVLRKIPKPEEPKIEKVEQQQGEKAEEQS